jgi:hypothetical protein
MKTADHRGQHQFSQACSWRPGKQSRTDVTLAALDVVTDREIHSLRHSLRSGKAPSDLRAKVSSMTTTDAQENSLKQRAVLLIDLLAAAEAGEFRNSPTAAVDQLLRVLAYFRKDDDVIPDSLPGGFEDDHELMRQVCGQFKPVLDRYKAWHLTERVPLLWNKPTLLKPDLFATFRFHHEPDPYPAQFQNSRHSTQLCSW